MVSPESIRRDHELKPLRYAGRGAAHHLVLDPLDEGHLATLWNPGPDGHRGRDLVPYGPDVEADAPWGRPTIPTGRMPVDPRAHAPA